MRNVRKPITYREDLSKQWPSSWWGAGQTGILKAVSPLLMHRVLHHFI